MSENERKTLEVTGRGKRLSSQKYKSLLEHVSLGADQGLATEEALRNPTEQIMAKGQDFFLVNMMTQDVHPPKIEQVYICDRVPFDVRHF